MLKEEREFLVMVAMVVGGILAVIVAVGLIFTRCG